MSPQDTLLETLLNRLEAGESLASLRAELGEAVDEYVDVIAFLQAQRLTAKPDPEGLRQALLQADLVQNARVGDEWGSFFAPWRRWIGGGVSLALLALVTANWWYPSADTVVVEETVAPQLAMRSVEKATFSEASVADSAVVVDEEDMALLQAWEADLSSELEDLTNTKAELESFYADPLFSSLDSSRL